MRRILAGLDTEYGFSVEGRGAGDQIEDAKALVRSYPGECLLHWDARFESPRSDLRGFKLESLAFDPEDAQFDVGRTIEPTDVVRADRVLQNGARFYNDHGHPEYATPETASIDELVLHDRAGDLAVTAAASAFSSQTGREVHVFKNNTDFHGASYGTHESYLVPRKIGVERLVRGLMPIFVARQILCGAGKVGAESGAKCDFQMSQRADFFMEEVNAETLYRRPIFNTRDEPHADPRDWIRLHVICGESNMIATALRIKVALVKVALELTEKDAVPSWPLSDPVRSIKTVSRAVDEEGRIELERSRTTPRQIIESYTEAYLRVGEDEEVRAIAMRANGLLDARFTNPGEFAKSVDWAAKRDLLQHYIDEEATDWRDPSLQALDLEYHRIDGEGGLYHALEEAGMVDAAPDPIEAEVRRSKVAEPTRARARSIAVTKFKDHLVSASWGTLTFKVDGNNKTVELNPDREYPATLESCETVERFIMEIEKL